MRVYSTQHPYSVLFPLHLPTCFLPPLYSLSLARFALFEFTTPSGSSPFSYPSALASRSSHSRATHFTSHANFLPNSGVPSKSCVDRILFLFFSHFSCPLLPSRLVSDQSSSIISSFSIFLFLLMLQSCSLSISIPLFFPGPLTYLSVYSPRRVSFIYEFCAPFSNGNLSFLALVGEWKSEGSCILVPESPIHCNPFNLKPVGRSNPFDVLLFLSHLHSLLQVVSSSLQLPFSSNC